MTLSLAVQRLNLEGWAEVQGYLYSKPVPANGNAALLVRLESD